MRKTIIIPLAVSFLTACGIQPTKNADTAITTNKSPSACQTQSQQLQTPGIYSAWETASSQAEALRLALGYIANQREITIRSDSVSTSQKQNGQSTQNFERKITASSDFIFNDYKIICQDHVNNEVLVSFDDRALSQRINSLLDQNFAHTGWQLITNNNLASSTAIAPLLRKEGITPTNVKLVISKNSSGWVINFNHLRLKLRDDEWRQLFTLPASHNEKIKLNIENEYSSALTHALFHEQEFRFTLKGDIPTPAFMSIYYLDKNANVVSIRENVLLLSETFKQSKKEISNQEVIIPKKGIFTAELPDNYDQVIDDYLLVLSKEPIQKPANKGLFNGWVTLFEKHETLGLRLTVR